MTDAFVLTLNVGSSSLKFSVFTVGRAVERRPTSAAPVMGACSAFAYAAIQVDAAQLLVEAPDAVVDHRVGYAAIGNSAAIAVRRQRGRFFTSAGARRDARSLTRAHGPAHGAGHLRCDKQLRAFDGIG